MITEPPVGISWRWWRITAPKKGVGHSAKRKWMIVTEAVPPVAAIQLSPSGDCKFGQSMA
jgi:hypothetical protein